LPGVGEQSSAAQYYKFLNKARDVSGKGPHDMDFMKETIFDVKGGEDYSKFTLAKLNKRSHEVQGEIRKIADNKDIPGTVWQGPKADLIKALHDSEVKKIQDARAIITRQDSMKRYGNIYPRLDPDNDAMIILGLDERGNPIKMGRFIGKFSATKHAETGELTRKEGTSFYDRWDSKKNRLRKVGDEVYHETLDSDSKVIMSNPDYKLPKTEDMNIWRYLTQEKVNIDALAKKGHTLQDIDMLMKGRAVNKYLDAQKLKEPGLDTGVQMHERSSFNDISNVMRNLYLRNDDVFRMSIDEWIKKIPEYFASGGHVPGFATGGVSNLFRQRYSRGKAVELITKLPEFIKFVEQLIIKASNQIRQGLGKWKGLDQKQRIIQHDNLTKIATEFNKTKKFDVRINEYTDIDAVKAFEEAQAKAERLGKGKNWKKKEVKAQAQELVSDKVVAKAYDEVFYQKPVSGDYKYDADVLAESIAEQLGKVYDDLPQAQQFEIYNIALKRVQQDLKFNMDKNKILKDVEQKMKLSDFDVTGKKGNAEGGLIPGFATGGVSELFRERQGFRDAGVVKLAKGASWILKNLRQTYKALMEGKGPFAKLNDLQYESYKWELRAQIKKLEQGEAIPSEMLDTMIKDKRFKDIVKTKSTDPELRELEEVLLDSAAGKNLEQQQVLEDFIPSGKGNAEGGLIPGYATGGVSELFRKK
jgi:hypothetical protein